jgi:hypothetical protein
MAARHETGGAKWKVCPVGGGENVENNDINAFFVGFGKAVGAAAEAFMKGMGDAAGGLAGGCAKCKGHGLGGFSTAELVEELKGRRGVGVSTVEPNGMKTYEAIGPAKVLTVGGVQMEGFGQAI